uniref:Uncharacterized protein n=1 Tax=Arundo donax TaxID=35708 RepID=A0A0A8Y679_ARUDO
MFLCFCLSGIITCFFFGNCILCSTSFAGTATSMYCYCIIYRYGYEISMYHLDLLNIK